MENSKEAVVFKNGADTFISVVSGKWKTLILCHLGMGTQRNSDLQKLIPGITHKMLNQQLRELEQDDIIVRTDFHEALPHVEYQLSAYGKLLMPLLNEVSKWGAEHVQHLQEKGVNAELEINDHDGYLGN